MPGLALQRKRLHKILKNKIVAGKNLEMTALQIPITVQHLSLFIATPSGPGIGVYASVYSP
ncbi:MAG: hypothetical protein CVV00_11780 [Firmicutes bacterium HGW-Firmicutes-5]|jgi:hypothetical protein|nr:MAG: hypothetical protein CVV00_11780 [Firmicutes bacterium HGW-Firmicutes-5]